MASDSISVTSSSILSVTAVSGSHPQPHPTINDRDNELEFAEIPLKSGLESQMTTASNISSFQNHPINSSIESLPFPPSPIRIRTSSSLSNKLTQPEQQQVETLVEIMNKELEQQQQLQLAMSSNVNNQSSSQQHMSTLSRQHPPIDSCSVVSSFSGIPISTLGESTKSLSVPALPQGNIYVSSEGDVVIKDDNDGSNYIPTLPTLKANMRICVVNENSKRSKDLFVPIDDQVMLFDDVYEHAAVKKAHVRKWGAMVVQQVKKGDCEIRCSVWDDVVESPVYSFTVEELKTTSTRELYQLVPESDVVKLVLQCVETAVLEYDQPLSGGAGGGGGATGSKRQISATSSRTLDIEERPLTGGGGEQGGSASSSSTLSSARHNPGVTTANEGLPEYDFAHPTLSRAHTTPQVTKSCSYLPSGDIVMPLKKDDGSTGSSIASARKQIMSPRSLFLQQNQTEHSPTESLKGKFRCPFSGIAVDQKIFQDFETQLQQQRSNSELNRQTAERHARGRSSTRSPGLSSNQSPKQNDNNALGSMPERLYNFHNTHRGSSSSGTTPQLQSIRQINPPPLVQTHSSNNSAADSDDTLTLPSTDEVLLVSRTSGHSSNDSSNSTMRIRISNEVSGRFKDLVVDINAHINLHDGVYEHQAAKNAHVRKWGIGVVQDVRKKVAEIQCMVVVGRGDAEKVCHTFSMEDLKTTSTKDLREMCPDCDPVRLVLKCVEKKRAEIDNNFNFSLVLERGKLQTETMKKATKSSILTNSRSEPCFAGGLRKSRPNHMNLSAMKNATFTSNVGPTGQKKNLLENYSSHETSRKNGLLNGVLAAPSSQESILSARSVDAILNRRKTRSSGRTEENSLASLSEGKPSDSNLSSLHDSNMTLSPTGPKPFAGKPQPSDKRPRPSQSQESLDPIQLLQKYTQSSRNVELNTRAESACAAGISVDDQPVRRRVRRPRETPVVERSGHEEQYKEFMRLCRSKKGSEHQSRDKLRSRRPAATSENGSLNATFPVLIHESMNGNTPLASTLSPGSNLGANKIEDVSEKKSKEGSRIAMTNAETERINRFLQYSASRKPPQDDSASDLQCSHFGEINASGSQVDNANGKRSSQEDCDARSSTVVPGVPPIAEIAVITRGSDVDCIDAPKSSISMSGEVVKEVFPYHIVMDEEFRILQVGNSLSLLIDGYSLIGQCVSDIFQITSPIPSFGKWEWSMLDKIKEGTVFLESISCNSSGQKARIKGTIIELSRKPRQVMFVMFPNVKNLSELENMNLSMVDLPLHSCQREAVLLGEHSKSEVKLTNHLDQLHRDLINSMEKQIEDRTTELATANQELEDANDQLARQSARQLEHFACMSHEIRTPLNCIVGMSSLLLEDSEEAEMDPMLADSIRMIYTSGELLKAVVDDVLDYAKLESGAFLVDIKPIKLQDTLDSVVHSISQKVLEKNIRLRTHFSPTLPEMIETDSRRLQQVLFNLLGNAGKFSKNDSVVELIVEVIHASNTEEQYTSVPSRIIRFAVKDYGKGIDSKDFEKIFKPFSQASKETQNVYGGTGLGLSITSKLVNRLGGSISVDSELDKYAQFTVDLPMQVDHLVDVQDVSKHLENVTIVVVEPKIEYDYSFTEYPITKEFHPLSKEVSTVFGLNVIRCNTLEEAFDSISSRDSHCDDHIAFIVHEDLYNHDADLKLSAQLGRSGFTLMTHGPNYLVENTKKRHFKSLARIFPVTLLRTIASHIESNKADVQSSLSNHAAATGLFTTLSSQQAEASHNTHNAHTPSASNGASGSTSETTTTKPEQRRLPRKFDLKVLYAEDNLVNQKVLSRVLNRAGITDITIVDDGKKAVDLSATIKFDCIFMDMQMPIMDGMEATQIIMGRDPGAKVIFVTAHALDEFKSRANSVGATSFISKPFRVSDIEKVLEETGICTINSSGASVDTREIECHPTMKAVPVSLPAEPPKSLFSGLPQKSQKQVKPLFEILSTGDVTTPSLVQKNTEHPPTVGKSLFPILQPLEKKAPASGNNSKAIQATCTTPSASALLPTPPRPNSISPKLGVLKSPSINSKKEPIPPRNLKVLYAEDNPINQKVLTRVLNRTGITDITIVDNGQKAVDITENTQFDCIFMDMQMPIMDGMEATKLIMERDSKSKVVFVTAHALEEYRKQAESLGARSFLSKPVRVADIEGVLAKLGL